MTRQNPSKNLRSRPQKPRPRPELQIWPRTTALMNLPAASLQQIFRIELAHVEPAHVLAELFGSFEHCLRIFEMGGRFDDGSGALFGIGGLENSRSDENRFGAQLTHQSGVGGRSDTAGGKI